MRPHPEHHPITGIGLLDRFFECISDVGLSFFKRALGLCRCHQHPFGGVIEAKPVQQAGDAAIDVAVRLNNAGYQGSSVQVEDFCLGSCQGSDLFTGSQLHDPFPFDRQSLVDPPHLG